MSTSSQPTMVRPGLVERTTTLALITIVGFVGNLLLLVTICQSAALRGIQFNKHVINMAIINLLTCIFMLPMVIGYTVTANWDYGETMCGILAHVFLTTSVATCLSILALNFDRVIAIYNPERYAHQMKVWKTSLLITSTWIVAIAFPLPLSLDVVSTNEFSSRYLCSISAGSDINYLVSFYSICFAFPAIVNVLFFVYIAREALSEKEAESDGRSSRPNSPYRLWPEVQSAGVVFIMYLVWVLFELPYFTITSVEQYSHSMQVNGEFSYSPDLDTVFTWLKFTHSCMLPLVIFKWRKDIWLKFKDLMFCRKSNSVLDSSPRMKQKNNANSKNRAKSTPTLNSSEGPKFEASFPIPTLKATKDGLHVHGNVEDDEVDSTEVFYANMDLTCRSDELNGKRMSALAVIEHHAEPTDQQEETSDYETDPYSQSDPISVRSAVSNQTPRSTEGRSKAGSISHDSGNNSASSSVNKKRRRKHRAVADLSIENTPPIVANSGATPSPQEERASSDIHPVKSHKPKRRPKSAVEAADEITTISDHNRSEDIETRPQKRKKKKSRQAVTDAQTNTSQLIDVEMIERRIPPPRLEPIRADSIPKSMVTPPLRSKVTRENVGEELRPPSAAISEKRRKHRSAEAEGSTSHERRRKRKSRPRNQSGDSESSWNNSKSSDMRDVPDSPNAAFTESQL